jgi:methylated-DNA-[protein]-cysteine S-methyltransferase
MTFDRPSPDEIVEDLLATGPGFGAPTGDRLRARLVLEAERRDLLDVSYRTIDSPVGRLLLAATSEGLVRVAFDCEDHDAVLIRLATEISPRILSFPERLEPVTRQLDEYFAGRRRRFEVAVDLRLARGFRRTVLDHLCQIGYGTTASYAAVAAASGSPAAVRAVGTACAHNPVPIVVPCHRVVRSDGTIGQYLGGTEAKHTLLAIEAA